MTSLMRVSLRAKGLSSMSKIEHSIVSSSGSHWQVIGKAPFSTATAGRQLLSKTITTYGKSSFAKSSVLPMLAGGSSWCCYSATTTKLESVSIGGVEEGSEIAQVYQRALVRARQRELHQSQHVLKRIASNMKRALRMLIRAVKLMCTLTPVVALYPVQRMLHSRDPSVDAHELALAEEKVEVSGALGWYLRMCLRCCEMSGAAVVKLMQWAGSRPDMFGHDFCAVFSKLQDDTTPHHWRHTERVLREAYGEDWMDRIKIDKNVLLGSGCIGQVYKGEVLDDDGKPMQVAVKVMHPSVEKDIDADLDLMRLFVRVVQGLPWDVFSNLKWLNLEGAVDEFSDLLKLQLDCRVEAANLDRFNVNFADSEHVVFPKIVKGYKPSKDVLIETFCEGMPVLKFAKEHRDNQELLSEMCYVAIEAVCKMIFLDNFMHGDLHPGNVFIDPKRKKFVLFDVGIVAAYTDDDHENIVDILTSLIRRQGRQAGRLMIDSSNRLLRDSGSGDHALDEELFIDTIEDMNKQACTSDYLMEHLGSYITTICNAAAKHHVLMNQAFISAALAVKVQEGIALALDPSIQIVDVATPILYESERRRGTVQKTAMKVLGLDTLFQGKKE